MVTQDMKNRIITSKQLCHRKPLLIQINNKKRYDKKMEEKHISLVILGVVAILAIVGLILLFNTAKTGAAIGARADQPYPGGVARALPQSSTYANPRGIVFPYSQRVTEYPTAKRDPSKTYGVLKGKCTKVIKDAINQGTLSAGLEKYTFDANINQMRNKPPQDCIQVENSLRGWCCIPPGLTTR